MRLTEEEIVIIKEAIYSRFRSVGRIILFGSRADDAKRGGDIDILVESDESIEDGVFHKLGALSEMHLRLGDRKIDFVLARTIGSEEDRRDGRKIVRVARETGVTL
jgi:predicted nucleotidyltransferase